jgi:hypothetical protein
VCAVFDMFLLCVVLMCLCGVVALFLLPRNGLLVSAPSVAMSLLADFALGMCHGSFAVARFAVPRPAPAMCVTDLAKWPPYLAGNAPCAVVLSYTTNGHVACCVLCPERLFLLCVDVMRSLCCASGPCGPAMSRAVETFNQQVWPAPEAHQGIRNTVHRHRFTCTVRVLCAAQWTPSPVAMSRH